MKTVPANIEVYVWQGAADMRAGFERLEAGAFRVEHRAGVEVITGVDLQELLSGMDLSRIKRKKRHWKRLVSSSVNRYLFSHGRG